MADEVLVKTVSASLTPANPAVTIVTLAHVLSSAPSGPFAASEANELMLESDIDAAFASYTTVYTAVAGGITYAGGTIKYQSLKSIDGLSALVKKKGEPIALKSTQGTITCSVLTQALSVSDGSPDATPSYDLDFSFGSAGQALTASD